MAKLKLRNQSSSNKDSSRKQQHYNKKEVNRLTRSPETERGQKDVRHDEAAEFFPTFTPLLVFAVTLIFRVLYVIDPKNWWMVHPDEVYQSVEVAHVEFYGYGFRTYDFSPPESPTDEATKYRQMQLNAHMYALRSPLFPYFYVLVSWLASLASIQVNPFVFWRVAHVIISSLLPLTVYLFVSKLYGAKNKACAASILVATSTHLNVFGTHCLLHSFLAPFTFLALSMLIDTTTAHDNPVTRQAHDCCRPTSQNEKMTTAKELTDQQKQEDLQNNNNTVITNISQNGKHNLKGIQQNPVSNKSNGINGVYNQNKKHEGSQQFHKNNLTSSSRQKYDVFLKSAEIFLNSTRTNCAQTAAAAFTATLICYIRPDVLVVFVINMVVFPETRPTKHWMVAVLGASVALAVGTSVDFSYYGWGVSSPVNWLHFNVVLGLSSLVFGQTKSWFYIENVFRHDIGILSLSVAAILAFCMLRFICSKEKSVKDNSNREGTLDLDLVSSNWLSLKSLSIWLVLFIIYSLNGHKETRFIHDAIIFLLIFVADILDNVKYLIHSRTARNNFIIQTILILFALTQWQSFPSHSNNLQWVYQKTTGIHDVNLCIKYISEQDDVTGVFYDSNLYMTGGTSLLHHDVPILSLVEGGFYEFGPESRLNYTREIKSMINGFAKTPNSSSVALVKSVNEFTRATNYIALANAQATLGVIIRKPVYNYLILQNARRFLDFGFIEVFSTTHSRVLRRNLDVDSEFALQGLLDRISVGNNVTVLLHEGDVLLNMNQYLEASARFYQALSLDQNLLEAYLPLQICYSKLGEDRAARAVRGRCLSLFDEVSCTTPRKMTRL